MQSTVPARPDARRPAQPRPPVARRRQAIQGTEPRYVYRTDVSGQKVRRAAPSTRRAELFDVVIPATGEPLGSRLCREQADEVCNRWNATQADTETLAEVMQTRVSCSDSLPPTRDEILRICAEIRSGWTAKEERQRRSIPLQHWLPPGALAGEMVLAPAC